jgi:hypothetical protein
MSGRLEFIRHTVAPNGYDHLDELLDVQQVRARIQAEFGIEAPSLQRLQSERRVFYVVCAGKELYPAFQWHEERLVTGLKAVLTVLTPYRSAWKILAWLSAANRELDGSRPADLLPFASAAVEAAARTEFRAGAASAESECLRQDDP